jgi:hypothetical protein
MNKESSPYCPVCNACGVEGCCSALACEQSPDGDYCDGYLKDLRFGYAMNEWFSKNLYDKMSQELKDQYDKEWDGAYNRFYREESKES